MIDPSLPLLDLHHHLDGSVRLETILDLGLKHNLPLPANTLEGLRPYVQVTNPQAGVMDFIEKFKWMVGILVDYDACRRVAYENVEDASRQGIDYMELRYSPWFMAEAHSLDPQGVVEAVTDGIRAGEHAFGVRANQIGILSRHYGPEIAHRELSALLSCKNEITALDLAGDEGNFPGEWFVDHFKKAREAGWHITVHAGEIKGPESVWQAIHGLGAERIGHAVHAVEDPALMAYLAEHRIGVECCLTSNVQTSTVGDYLSHPLREFLKTGLLATLNTDDPGISAIDLPYEYEVAAPAAGLSIDQIRQVQKNALEIAFLSKEEKNDLIEKKRTG
ncbi:MAG TPA: adenosine deaminase [Anaerolineaceae bacterium]|nr:adenosine deaminase [Anaerolineaceae bacterium]